MNVAELQKILNDSEVPILIDFWADWCGPCKMLKPILEKLEQEADGKWRLIKIDTQQFPELATHYGVRGIPDVRLFYKGEQINQFTGALPEFQVRQWLENNLPSKEKQRLEEIREILLTSPEKGLTELQNFVQEHPNMEEGILLYAQQLLYLNPSEAKKLVTPIKRSSKFYKAAQNIIAISELFLFNDFTDSQASLALKEFKEQLLAQNMNEAIEALIKTVMLNKTIADSLAKRAGLALFDMLGEQHELSKKYLRKFRMAVY